MVLTLSQTYLVEDAEGVKRPDDHGSISRARDKNIVARVDSHAGDHALVVL